MIAYDTNVLIYALEGNSVWAEAAQAIVEEGEHNGAVLSVLAWQELLTGAVLNTDSDGVLASLLDDLSATKFVPVTQRICAKAIELTKQYGKRLYGYDAIHLATALDYKANTYITNDRALLGIKIEGLEIRGL
jgi:predicted nucleic acid-binding protein